VLFSEEKYRFMYSALQEAEKAFEDNEVPVGAVVVFQKRIIGRGYNQVEKLNDPTAHAEMIALTAASFHLSTWRLSECDIYITLEPCVMCTGALLHSRVKNLYFGAFDPKFGACGSIYNIAEEGKYNHKIDVYSGIYENESKEILKKFFGNVRLKT
jgi:tRNA(adenine34) deaminase